MLALIASLRVIEAFFPEPSFVDGIPALLFLVLVFGPSLLLWGSGDYSHENPRYQFLGVRSSTWGNFFGVAVFAFMLYLVFQSPSLRLPWQLPDEAEVVYHCEVTQVQLSLEQFEALIDKMELRNCRQPDGSYLKSGTFSNIRVRFEDGIMTLEEWTN
ncbi:MAG: hypothetical protein RL095_1880 [Verrucomicrobiota bacterium]